MVPPTGNCSQWVFCINQPVDTYKAVIKGEYLVKNTTDIRIDVIFYD